MSSTRRRIGATSASPSAPTPRVRSGFTLISMIVAVTLLTVGLLSLAGANSQTIVLQTISQNRTNAIAIARAYVEQVRTRDPWLLKTEPVARLNSEGATVANGPYVRTMTVTEVRQNLIRIEVRVDFPRGNKPVLLTTMMFRGNGLSGEA
ncbi:MAG TPA: prepilin-type N-terminal cleavage/methylation domain-containing protein [Gemmatimonas sp.]|uniref:type IV pilus modification PilV family protein n=1 Tax=Gemmatimonas sp. TaxID=1962908 RepID=UPI002ED89FC1